MKRFNENSEITNITENSRENFRKMYKNYSLSRLSFKWIVFDGFVWDHILNLIYCK